MKPYITLVPIYKPALDADEAACVARHRSVLTEGDFAFLAPMGLDTSWYEARYPGAAYVRFEDRFFRGTNGYNHLMLDERFYGRFADYAYLLIAQPDAVIWQERDRIAEFIALGYDYYGAPWIPERRIWEWLFPRKESFPFFRIRCCKRTGSGITMGNGGFSLRRVEACRALIHQYRWRKLYWYWKRNEDIFFGLCGSDNRNDFRLADVETGRSFALEYGLRESVARGEAPYAVHGWSKEYADYQEMQAYLKGYGIEI